MQFDELVQMQAEVNKQQARQAKQLEKLKKAADEVEKNSKETKEAIEQARDELSCLREFILSQPGELDQDTVVNLIDQAFQRMASALDQAI